jgi:hypothetical protein
MIKGGSESKTPAKENIATYPAPGRCGQKELKGEFSFVQV